jgi:hypothetical protein
VPVALVCLALVACGFPKPHDVGSDDAAPAGSDAAIDAPPDGSGVCDVLTQMGCAPNERCTYVNEGSALGQMCVPMGTAGHGSACATDATTGIDNCMAGDVCAGSCKTVCSAQGSDTCGSGFVCDAYTHGNGIDPNGGTLVRSPYSDTVGFCFDHSKFQYDSNGDDVPDTTVPPCSSLPTGISQDPMMPHAADWGCEDTAHAGLFTGKLRRIPDLRIPGHW